MRKFSIEKIITRKNIHGKDVIKRVEWKNDSNCMISSPVYDYKVKTPYIVIYGQKVELKHGNDGIIFDIVPWEVI